MMSFVSYLGIFGSSGTIWKEQRTFALSSLRKFGFGKKSHESKIIEEVEVFLQILEDSKNEPIDITDAIQLCVSNVICSIALGKHFEHNDPDFVVLIELVRTTMKTINDAAMSEVFPFVKYIPGDRFNRKTMLDGVQHLLDLMADIVDEHKKTYDENNIRDFVDCYIKELATSNSETFTGDCKSY